MPTCNAGHDLDIEGRTRQGFDRRYGKAYTRRECRACARLATARLRRVATYGVERPPDPFWARFCLTVQARIETIRRDEGFDSRCPDLGRQERAAS